ncbi:hypothetical protein [Dyadobacter tibetensis]|uniref:hypothetical protein n=1 Tax=Dyadobacter tibetensis TaxID=1211851 RepID=UPI000470FED4|nr:hypothetical protein [Dyadobacter tibetensis]
MKTKKLINQAITILMSAMVLMVAAGRSWPVTEPGIVSGSYTSSLVAHTDKASSEDALPSGTDVVVRALSLNAVITPSLSFDFLQYLHLLPTQLWQMLGSIAYLLAPEQGADPIRNTFCRIFGVSIVTNAP